MARRTNLPGGTVVPRFFFFFNDTPTPEISPLPLHDALPIWQVRNEVEPQQAVQRRSGGRRKRAQQVRRPRDRDRSEEHTSELQSQSNLVCRLLLEKKKRRNDSGSPGGTSGLCSRLPLDGPRH